MKKEFGPAFGIVVLALLLGMLAGGCSKEREKKLNKQIQEQINLIDREVKAVEQHQEAMAQMVKEMQTQLNALQEELNKESPRIHAANSAVTYLRELTTVGMGESPAHATLREPGWNHWNYLWVALFVLLLWFFYRRHRATTAE